MKNTRKVLIALALFVGLGVASSFAAYTGSVDYVAGVETIADGQWDTFLRLLNGPIGYLIMFVIGLQFLKWNANTLK